MRWICTLPFNINLYIVVTDPDFVYASFYLEQEIIIFARPALEYVGLERCLFAYD